MLDVCLAKYVVRDHDLLTRRVMRGKGEERRCRSAWSVSKRLAVDVNEQSSCHVRRRGCGSLT